ncbi:hypothetical protein B0H11DRAFT_1910764 [Mycena galericulata]|nr:hypothetical protein B0H11DRAFT_1910764 [Mycena galericulata]
MPRRVSVDVSSVNQGGGSGWGREGKFEFKFKWDFAVEFEFEFEFELEFGFGVRVQVRAWTRNCDVGFGFGFGFDTELDAAHHRQPIDSEDIAGGGRTEPVPDLEEGRWGGGTLPRLRVKENMRGVEPGSAPRRRMGKWREGKGSSSSRQVITVIQAQVGVSKRALVINRGKASRRWDEPRQDSLMMIIQCGWMDGWTTYEFCIAFPGQTPRAREVRHEIRKEQGKAAFYFVDRLSLAVGWEAGVVGCRLDGREGIWRKSTSSLVQ